MTKTELAYIAGMLDGDGYLGIRKTTSNDFPRRTGYDAIMTVANTNFRVLEWLQQITGEGKIYTSRPPDHIKYRSKWGTWTLWSGAIGRLLPRVRPFLIVKSSQADVLLEFLKVKGKYQNGSRGRSATEWREQDRLYTVIKASNRPVERFP